MLHGLLVLLHLRVPVLFHHLSLLRVFGHEGDGCLVVEARRQHVARRLTQDTFTSVARLASVITGSSLLLQDDLFDPLRWVLHLHLFGCGLGKRFGCFVKVDGSLYALLMFCGHNLAELSVEHLGVRRVVHVSHQLLCLKS